MSISWLEDFEHEKWDVCEGGRIFMVRHILQERRGGERRGGRII